jgi:hypothetical protein
MSDSRLETIEAFLMDKDLKELEKKLDQFDLFRILKIASREVTMSSILAWILDPNESHNMGDYFLRQFLLNIIIQNKSNEHLNSRVFSIINLDILNLSDIYVQTEEVFSNKRRGDISLVDNSNKIYILIENKIFSGEGDSQTTSYYQEAQKRYEGYDKLFVYLTPDGDSPEDPHFLPLSYSTIKDLLVDLMENKRDELSESSYLVIDQMKKNIDDNITEQTLNDLCLRLYNNHKIAIDLIIAAKPATKHYYQNMALKVVKALDEEWDYKCTNSYCAIFKKSWVDKLSTTTGFSIVHYEFNHLANNNLRILIHIESQNDQETYDRLREEIKKTDLGNIKNIKIGEPRSLYSKLVKRNIDPEDIDNVIEIGAKDMVMLINKTSNYFDTAVDAASKLE